MRRGRSHGRAGSRDVHFDAERHGVKPYARCARICAGVGGGAVQLTAGRSFNRPIHAATSGRARRTGPPAGVCSMRAARRWPWPPALGKPPDRLVGPTPARQRVRIAPVGLLARRGDHPQAGLPVGEPGRYGDVQQREEETGERERDRERDERPREPRPPATSIMRSKAEPRLLPRGRHGRFTRSHLLRPPRARHFRATAAA